MEVIKTTNYNIFKKYAKNREIDLNLVEIFKLNLAKCNLLQFRPVLVNDKMEVMDGQHRLEACRLLGLPVWYQVKSDMNDNELLILNSVGKPWTMNDYLEFYIKKGNKNYIICKEIMERYRITINFMLNFAEKKEKVLGKPFREGRFVMIKKEKVIEIFEMYHEIREYLIQKMESQARRFVNNRTFFTAIVSFLTHPGVEKDIFIHKLEMKLGLLRPCTCVLDYLRIFQAIYNFRNTNPINLVNEVV